jgi:hypothetical protein
MRSMYSSCIRNYTVEFGIVLDVLQISFKLAATSGPRESSNEKIIFYLIHLVIPNSMDTCSGRIVVILLQISSYH